MKVKLFIVTALTLSSPLLACDEDGCDGIHHHEVSLATCADGKCPAEMIKRNRDIKRLQKDPVDAEEEVDFNDGDVESDEDVEDSTSLRPLA
jgi:hypothetical protein